MKEIPENKTEQLEEVKEKVESAEEMQEESEEKEQLQGTEVLSDTGISVKTGIYIGMGVLLALVVLALLGKKRKMNTQKIEKEQSIGIDEKVKKDTNMQAAKVHEIGKREEQQDSFGMTDLSDEEMIQKKGILLVVADGMGGLSDGGRVSSVAVKTCHDLFYQMPDHSASPDMLLKMAAAANKAVCQSIPKGQRSGTTLVTGIIRNGYLHFLTIGDSRIYLYRSGNLMQLNREHTYREELALAAVNGLLPVGKIQSDPQTKSLTSYLGNGRISHLDRNAYGLRLEDKDRILLASDGVFGTLIPEQLEAVLALPLEKISEKMKEMIESIDKPFQDNYTALVFEYRM